MNNPVNGRQDEWQQHVTAYRNGTLSKAAYCKLHILRYTQFGYWIQKYKLNTH